MTKEITVNHEKRIARPLGVLIPLIRTQIKSGDEAGLEHYRKAGEMLLEARKQVAHGEWNDWVQRNFNRTTQTAGAWMALATKSNAGVRFKTLSHSRGDFRKENHQPEWTKTMKERLDRINLEPLSKPTRDDEAEEKLERKLALELIEIGYRALATKLHPDKRGGSSEAMARLNTVRDNLRASINDW